MEKPDTPTNNTVFDTMSNMGSSINTQQSEVVVTKEDTTDPVLRVQQSQVLTYNCPLPPPEILDGYEKHIPKFGIKLFDYVKVEQAERFEARREASRREDRKLDILEKSTEEATKIEWAKTIIGLVLALICIVIAIICFSLGMTAEGIGSVLTPAIYYIGYVLATKKK